MLAVLARSSAGKANKQFRAVQQVFKWLHAEEEIGANPMLGLQQPKVGEVIVPLIPDETLSALFASCAGQSFEDRRDLAILRLCAATGIRLGEMAGLLAGDVDIPHRETLVRGKGRKERIVRFDATAAQTLDR